MKGKELAVVTGASSGIGLELARCCVDHGYNLVIAADDPDIEGAAEELRARGADVETVLVDLATEEGVSMLIEAIGGRPDAGHGLGHAFLDQDFADIRHVIDTNITGTSRARSKRFTTPAKPSSTRSPKPYAMSSRTPK